MVVAIACSGDDGSVTPVTEGALLEFTTLKEWSVAKEVETCPICVKAKTLQNQHLLMSIARNPNTGYNEITRIGPEQP